MRKQSSGSAILDWAVIIAAVALFTKTADVLAYFAPTNINDFFGSDMSIWYGLLTALLVEGVALALHFHPRARHYVPAEVVKWFLLIVVSGSCQIFDGYLVQRTQSQMSEPMKQVLSYGVPLIPLLLVVFIFWIGKLPDLDHDGIPDVLEHRPRPLSEPRWKGVKPMWDQFWQGLPSGTPGQPRLTSYRSTSVPKEPNEMAEVSLGGNGARPEGNPTIGSGKNHRQPLP